MKKNIEVTYLTGRELATLLWAGGNNGRNSDIFKKILYLHPNELARENHILAVENGKIVGNIALQLSPYDESEVWLKHVSVHPDYRNQGISKAMISKMFTCLEEGLLDGRKKLKRSMPSDMGLNYLTHTMERAKEEHPQIEVVDWQEYPRRFA